MIALFALPAAAFLLVVAGFAGNGAAGALVLILVLLAAVTTPTALGLRAGRAVSAAIAVAGVAGVSLAWAESARATGWPDSLDHLLPALALCIPLAALAMLADRGDRRDLVMSLALTAAIAATAVLGSAWMALWWAPIGGTGLAIAGCAIATAGIVLLAGPWWAARAWPREALLAAAVVLAAPGGLVALLFVEVGSVPLLTALLLGLVAAGTAVVGRTWVMVGVSERLAEPTDGRPADFDQGVVLATSVAMLLPAVPVFVFARILVG